MALGRLPYVLRLSSSTFYRCLNVKDCSYNMNLIRFRRLMAKVATSNCKNTKSEDDLFNISACNPIFKFDFLYQKKFFSSDTSMSKEDIKKKIDGISDKFAEALELLNDARSSVGTVYFSDDMNDAEEMVEEILKDYKTLLQQLNEEQRLDVQRTIGLKMEELQAQLTIIKSTPSE